jgi:hypothetical protein
MKKTVETVGIQRRWNEIRSAFQELNRALPAPEDGAGTDLGITIAKAVILKTATQAMISTLKAQQRKDAA